jgi:hypothetical protein
VLQVLPRHFQRPSEDDHQRVPTSLRTVFTKLITINTRTSTTTTWQNYNLSHAPQVTLDVAPSPNHASGTDVSIYENYPSSEWSTQCLFNTTTYLSSTRPPSSWTQTAASVTSLWTTVSPCLPPYVLLPVFSMIAANQLQRNCEMPLHSLSDRYPVSSKRSYKDRHLHRWSSKRFELHHFRQRGGRRCQDQRRTRRLR